MSRDSRSRRLSSRVLIAVAAATLALWLLALNGAGPAEAAFPGSNGKIAFTSNRDVGAGEIYTITPGGTATRITFSNRSSDPAYSPDGSRIAFVSTGNQIFVMNADGSGRRRVTTTSTAKTEPTWSADGTQIAYVANSFDVDRQTDLEIWAINADGSGRRQLTKNSFPDSQPAWSPLGDKIAFVSARTGDTNRNVYVMNSDGSGQRSVTPNSPPGCSPNCYQGHDDNPAWSPDGSKIAYVHGGTISGGGLPDIWTMDPNGANKRNVSNNDAVAFTQPAWSPNGKRFAAVGTTDTNRNIWVMNSNGSGQTAIDTNPGHDINPDWQPAPRVGRTVLAQAVRGSVFVRVPGSPRFVPLRSTSEIPVRSLVNATRGRVRISSASNNRGGVQKADFYDGTFQVLQRRSARPITDIVLKGGSLRACRGKGEQVAERRRRLRRLLASGRGRFRTRGRYSASTVRGTVWLTAERCDGTLTRVLRGRVVVRDFRLGRNITLRAGQSYLARVR
jgi:Tol biopolymer transport system component